MNLRHRAFDLAFRAINVTGADRWAAPLARGRGVILTLHRVCDASSEEFQPNRILEITPDFLDEALAHVRARGIDLVSMDEAQARLGRDDGRFFAALTFDDGFRDTFDVALPVLRQHQAPATVYCVPGFASRTAPLWWVDLEEAIRKLPRIEIKIAGKSIDVASRTSQQKASAFDAVYWCLRQLPEQELRAAVAKLAAQAGHDSAACTGKLCLDWAGLAQLAADPLITIGAHTLTHPRLATLPEAEARHEMLESRAELEARLGVPVRHFAYPVGDVTSAGERDYALASGLGFATAVTTRPGHVHARHASRLMALPRVSLNGLHQNSHAFRALLSGLPFIGMNN
ncbi:MAG: polysaccharide deacetylase family protein [Bosea sp. (in: a-proteobacteria)]